MKKKNKIQYCEHGCRHLKKQISFRKYSCNFNCNKYHKKLDVQNYIAIKCRECVKHESKEKRRDFERYLVRKHGGRLTWLDKLRLKWFDFKNK
jgi:hypothetical protein